LQTPVGQDGTQLSGGQQRRVAVARALLAETPVLLLDEPTTGLDPATEARLIDDLLAVTRGKTLIMVTHQPRLTDRADQVVRVDGGRITSAIAPPAGRRPVAVPA
jgi:ABC-type transport system involved in cytochrome bd biosynthesis fused ATPase/permease subunit